MKYVVKYEDYKRFHAKSRIIFGGETLTPNAPDAKPAAPTPPDPNGLPPKTDPNAVPPPDPDAPPLKRPK